MGKIGGFLGVLVLLLAAAWWVRQERREVSVRQFCRGLGASGDSLPVEIQLMYDRDYDLVAMVDEPSSLLGCVRAVFVKRRWWE